MTDFLTWRLAAAACAVALAGLVRGFSGFGSAMVMIPALSALYGPAVAVPVGLFLDILLAVPFVPGAARLVRWRQIFLLCIAAAAFVPVGAWVLLNTQAVAMRWAISAVVLLFVAILAFGWRYHGRPRPGATAAAGAASGLLTGASGMGGPPIIFYYLSGPDPAGHVRASFLVYFAIVDAAAITALWWQGAFAADRLALGLALTPPYLGAAWLGAHSFHRGGERYYRRVALAILAAVAIGSLVL